MILDKTIQQCYDNKAFRDARVVELADSLDSGSSAHSGRAGSSPASRTISGLQYQQDIGVLFCPRPLRAVHSRGDFGRFSSI